MIFGLPQRSSTSMKKSTEPGVICCLIFRLIYLESDSRPRSSGRWQRTVNKQSSSSSHCPFTARQAVNSVPASLPSFKAPPVVGFLVWWHVLPVHLKKNWTAAVGGCVAVPCSRVWLYTEQHAHEIWTVLYCDGGARCVIHKYGGILPSLQRVKRRQCHAEQYHTCWYVRAVCLCASPVAPAGRARWQWISCCCFLTQQSSLVSCKKKKKITEINPPYEISKITTSIKG